jgi:hypothetical protein
MRRNSKENLTGVPSHQLFIHRWSIWTTGDNELAFWKLIPMNATYFLLVNQTQFLATTLRDLEFCVDIVDIEITASASRYPKTLTNYTSLPGF